MSGFITLGDGRTWTASNGAFDAVVTAIAGYLHAQRNTPVFADWLLTQRAAILGPGMGDIDVRELTPLNQRTLYDAIEVVCGGVSLPGELNGWPDRVRLLAAMVRSYRAGEPPEALNPHMRSVFPPTGLRSGPGWDDADQIA